MLKWLKKIGLMVVAAGMLSTPQVMASEEGVLQIWMRSDKPYNGLQKLGDQFEKDTGIPVKVEHPDGAIDKYIQAAQAGKGPDAFQWAHDRLGDMVNGGLIQPLDIDSSLRKKVIEKAWRAFTMNGELWGYPMGIEAIGLVYNKDLVPNPPKTFEEVFELNKSLKQGEQLTFLYDYNNFYFSFPLLAADGGYVFAEKDDGSLDPAQVGLANSGAKAGAEMIMKLINDGVMPKGASYSVMDSKMNKGELGMMINGPWSWANLSKNRINFGVTTIPSINGQPSKPFVGVTGFMVNRSTKNAELVNLFFSEYMLSDSGMKTLDDDVPIGVSPLKTYFFKEQSKDDNIKASMENVKVGVLMPSISEMTGVWSAMGAALPNMTNGRQTVDDALATAVERIMR